MFCVWKQIDEQHVECVQCHRRLSGKPERYENKIVCQSIGPGAELEKLIKKLGSFFNVKPNCSTCDTTKRLMNEKGKQWCRENRALLAAIIQYNAKTQHGIKVPRMLLRAAVYWSTR